MRGDERQLDVLGDLHIGDDKVEPPQIQNSTKNGSASVDIGMDCSDCEHF